MIPVPGLSSVTCAWVDIKAQGFSAHGFLVFLASDHFFPQYLDGDGLSDLDTWTGEDSAIFVVQSPSAAWVDYTRATEHAWWKLFGHLVEGREELEQVLATHGTSAVLQIDGNTRTLQEVFAPCLNHFQHSHEIAKVLHRFNLQPTDHPALILFRDIRDREVWYVNLSDLVNIPERDLRTSLQQWFAGREFRHLISEVQNAKR